VTDQHAPLRPKSFAPESLRRCPSSGERYPIRSIGIFGSWARGEQTDESDVDLLVALREPVGYFELGS
jgi:predicted nucleotidyltransferase